jgi:hypothetical protein
MRKQLQKPGSAQNALRPDQSDDQLDMQSLPRVRERWVVRRTAVVNQIRGLLLGARHHPAERKMSLRGGFTIDSEAFRREIVGSSALALGAAVTGVRTIDCARRGGRCTDSADSAGERTLSASRCDSRYWANYGNC